MDNVEEDIKLLERFNPGDEHTERIKQAIKNILAEREDDKKRIKELEEHLKKFYTGELYTAKQLKQIEENQKKYFINKQKVKGNIEKHKIAKEGLEKEYGNKKYEDDDLRASDFYGIVTQDRIIQVLEELLEDK